MKRIFVLACATLVFGLGSPLAAQEMAQAAPDAQQLPPPPPFPPMPSSKPSHRVVNLGSHHTNRARSNATIVRHAPSVKRDRKAHASSKAHANSKTRANRKDRTSHKAIASRRSAHKEKAMHFSPKTIRSCHAMTYRQIMRSSSCKAMMKQELAAPTHKDRTSKKASAKHKAATRSKTKSHSTAKKRRR